MDEYITWAEDKHTALAKLGTTASKFAVVESTHDRYQDKADTSALQKSRNTGYNLRAKAKWAVQNSAKDPMSNSLTKYKYAHNILRTRQSC